MNKPLVLVTALIASAGAAFVVVGIADISKAASASGAGHDRILMSEALNNITGINITAVLVDYGPADRSPPHHHAGSVFAYVLRGAIRLQNSATGPERVYHTDESFFEPAGSIHLVSENASMTTPASLLAVFVAPSSAQLTTPEHPAGTH